MNRFFVLVKLLNKFLNAILVIITFRRLVGLTFIRENNFQSRIQKRQLAQTLAQTLADAIRLELNRLAENFLVRQERDQRAGMFRFTDDMKLLDRFTAFKFHVINFAIARDFHFKPFTDGVNAFRADAVCAAGKFITALPIFSAGMKRREHHFDTGNFVCG